MLSKIDGLGRIRISSIEPTTIPTGIVSEMASPGSKLCRYLHVPLQAGSDAILKAMSRKYTMAEFDSFIQDVHYSLLIRQKQHSIFQLQAPYKLQIHGLRDNLRILFLFHEKFLLNEKNKYILKTLTSLYL